MVVGAFASFLFVGTPFLFAGATVTFCVNEADLVVSSVVLGMGMVATLRGGGLYAFVETWLLLAAGPWLFGEGVKEVFLATICFFSSPSCFLALPVLSSSAKMDARRGRGG